MSNEPKETNLFGASVSQKLDIFRYTEQDGERACHIAQAADDARTLEAEVRRLTDENEALISSADSLMNTRIELEKEVQRLTNKCNAMREQLRWRSWPDEKPEPNQKVICDDDFYEYLEEPDGAMWGDPCGDAYECCTGDRWLPIPQDNMRPVLGGAGVAKWDILNYRGESND